jgi:hypothetical protein
MARINPSRTFKYKRLHREAGSGDAPRRDGISRKRRRIPEIVILMKFLPLRP